MSSYGSGYASEYLGEHRRRDFYWADEVGPLLDSQQSKLEDQEKDMKRIVALLHQAIDGHAVAESKMEEMEKEVARLKGVEEFVECTGRARAVMDRAEAAEARVRELESQLEAAKVEGFNEGVDKCQRIVFQETGTNCSRTYGRIEKLRVADSKRGGE